MANQRCKPTLVLPQGIAFFLVHVPPRFLLSLLKIKIPTPSFHAILFPWHSAFSWNLEFELQSVLSFTLPLLSSQRENDHSDMLLGRPEQTPFFTTNFRQPLRQLTRRTKLTCFLQDTTSSRWMVSSLGSSHSHFWKSKPLLLGESEDEGLLFRLFSRGNLVECREGSLG